MSSLKGGAAEKKVLLDNISLQVHAEPDQAALKLYADVNPGDTLRIEIEPLIISLLSHYDAGASFNIPPGEMILEASNRYPDAKIYISNINMVKENEGPGLTSLKGKLLLKIKG